MSLPGKTVTGVAAVLSARSACAAVDTTSVAVAELAPKAWFPALTVAVSLMTVPLAVLAFTVYTTVKVPDEPGATLEFVQLTGGEVHIQPEAGVTDAKVTSAVGVGVDSEKVAALAAADPVLVTTCV